MFFTVALHSQNSSRLFPFISIHFNHFFQFLSRSFSLIFYFRKINMFDCDCNLMFVFHLRNKPTKIIFTNFFPSSHHFSALSIFMSSDVYLLIEFIVESTSLNFHQALTTSPFKFHFVPHKLQKRAFILAII